MKNATWRARARRTFAVIASTALAGSLAVVNAGTAAADEGDYSVTSGDAQWGVKQSFRNYITSPIAHGNIEVIEPATRTDDGSFTFEATGGTVTETATGMMADIVFDGGVHFTGHEMDDVHALDIDISNVAVHIEGDTGTLVADVVSREFIDTTTPGELQEYPAVELGEIDLSDAPLTVTDGVASVTDAPVTMTEDGAPAFGNFYEVGTELDPLSFSVDLEPAGAAPEITTQPEDVSVDEGADATFTADSSGTPEPTIQWQTRTDADGEWTDADSATDTAFTLSAVTAAQDGTHVRAVFSNGAETDAVTEAATLTVVPAGEPEEPVFDPEIEVYAADGETELGDAEVTYGDTVVVEGSGFDPAANVGGRGVPIPSDLPQGTYVVFGKFAEQWEPSTGAPSDARVIGSQKWALAEDVMEQVPPQFQDTIREQWVDIADDGTFTAELEIAEPTDGDGEVVAWPEEGSFGVYTYGAGGVTNAEQEQSAPVNVVDEITDPEDPGEPTEPEVTVSPTEDLAIDTVVTVEGTGYAPNRAISVAFTSNEQQHEEFGWPMGWLNHEVVTTDDDGSFSREITVSGWVTGTGADCSEVECSLATFNSAQASDVGEVDRRAERDQDAFVPVTFVAGYPPEPDPDPEPGTPAVSADPNPVHQNEDLTVNGSELPAGAEVTALLEASTASATGALDWGIKESFRSYVTGPIAHGSIELSDDVTENSDGTYRFPATLASVDEGAGTAVLSFAGSVSFQGHEIEGTPALEVHLSDLRVQVSQESATLLADVTSREFVDPTSTGELVDYPDVSLATVDRDAFDIDGETVTATDATATLTADGAPAFAGFYDEGTELDPIDVEVSAASTESAGIATSDAAEDATEIATAEIGEDGLFETVWTVPEEFAVGAYAVVLRDADGAALVSDPLTVLAAGPEDPGDGDEDEPDKPEPDEPTEPAQGSVVVEPNPVEQGSTATFTGTDLTPGTSVGAVIDASGAPGTLEWGVKESFRDYIVGSIAHGEISVTAPATETGDGTFLFGEGSGSGDTQDATADFGGAVTFTGHEMNGVHALELTVTDPSVVIEDGAGYLVADVTSRSLDGNENVDYPRVRLADLDLSGVEVDDGRLVGTDVPATLTADGVPAFADFYEEGDALDPVSFSVSTGGSDEADLGTLDVAAVTVDEDGTAELSWAVPADFTPGDHQVDLVTDGASVANTTFTVTADDAGASPDPTDDPTGNPVDDGDDRPTAGPGGDDRLPDTGADTNALVVLAATVMLGGVVILGGTALLGTSRRQRV